MYRMGDLVESENSACIIEYPCGRKPHDGPSQSGPRRGGVKIVDTPVMAVADFNIVDTCAGFFAEAWSHSNSRLTISPGAFHKSVNACRNVLELALQANICECSASE